MTNITDRFLSAFSWEAEKVREMIRELDPDTMVNTRLVGQGDYETPELYIPLRPLEEHWELCSTFNDSWGYRPQDVQYKDIRQIVRMLTECMEQGVLVNRKILAVGTKIYIICDELYASGPHSCRQYFHLAPQCNISMMEGANNTVCVKGSHFDAKICCLSEDVTAAAVPFPVSRHYNQMERAETVTFTREPAKTGAKVTSMITVIFCKDHNKKTLHQGGIMDGYAASFVPVISSTQERCLENWEADGILLSCPEKDYLVVIAHMETGAGCEYIGAMNHYGLGRVMVAELSSEESGQRTLPGEEKNMTVLCW